MGSSFRPLVKVPLNASDFLNFDNISLRPPSSLATDQLSGPLFTGQHSSVRLAGRLFSRKTASGTLPTASLTKSKVRFAQENSGWIRIKPPEVNLPEYDSEDMFGGVEAESKGSLLALGPSKASIDSSAVSKDSIDSSGPSTALGRASTGSLTSVPSKASVTSKALVRDKVSLSDFHADLDMGRLDSHSTSNFATTTIENTGRSVADNLQYFMHPSNPFFGCQDQALVRQKVTEVTTFEDWGQDVGVQDGGEGQGSNPFLDNNPEMTPDLRPPRTAAQETEAAWTWSQRYPPGTPSTYFPVSRSAASGKKAYRNRRSSEEKVSPLARKGNPKRTSTPSFLLELRGSVSNISLIPAVSSVPSLPTSDGSRRSFHSQSDSSDPEDPYPLSEGPEVGAKGPRRKPRSKAKSKKKNVKGNKSRQLSATSSLGSKIIEILKTYNNVEETPDHVDLLLQNLPPSPRPSSPDRQDPRPDTPKRPRSRSVSPRPAVSARAPIPPKVNRTKDLGPTVQHKVVVEVKGQNTAGPPRVISRFIQPPASGSRNMVLENIFLAKYPIVRRSVSRDVGTTRRERRNNVPLVQPSTSQAEVCPALKAKLAEPKKPPAPRNSRRKK